MRHLRFLVLVAAIFSSRSFAVMTSEAVCDKAGGHVERGSSNCDKSCNYYRTLYKNNETSMRCARNMLPRCICPEGECYENGKCKDIPQNILAFFLAKTSQVVDRAKDPKGVCKKAGGTWNTFPDACAGSCTKHRSPGTMCATVVTEGCDCGAGKCFENNACLDN